MTIASDAEQEVLVEAGEQFQSICRWMIDGANFSLEHGEVENYLSKEGMELLRRLFQAHLNERARCEEKLESVTGADKEVRAHRRANSERKLETIFGEVKVRRIEYSTKESGCPSIYLGDAHLNLPPDKFSDGLRRRAAEESSKVSFEEAAEAIQSTTAGHVAKRQCEELSVKVAADFEAFYASRSVQVAEEDTEALLVLTTDSKGIVMNEQDLRPATAKAAQESEHKCRTRLSAGEKRNRKRMATVASVYGVERNVRTAKQIMGDDTTSGEVATRPKITNKRVWASVELPQVSNPT